MDKLLVYLIYMFTLKKHRQMQGYKEAGFKFLNHFGIIPLKVMILIRQQQVFLSALLNLMLMVEFYMLF